ncbi:hypothetical protein D3C71_2199710 [compost metagenome]
MQLDEAGDQIVAFKVLAAGNRALGNVGNLAVADQHRTVEDTILEDDAGVGQNLFFAHLMRSFVGCRCRAAAGSGQ